MAEETCYKCGKTRAEFSSYRLVEDLTVSEPLFFRTQLGSVICLPCTFELINKDAYEHEKEPEDSGLIMELPGTPKDKHTHWEFEGRVAALEFKVGRLEQWMT